MKHIPNKIYLQIGEDCDAEDFKDLNEVTWCQVEIHSNDIEYVRSSQQPEGEVLEALKALAQRHKWNGHGTGGCVCKEHLKAEEILAKHKERR